MEIYAHVDESGGRLPTGRRVYSMAAVLTAQSDHDAIRAALRGLLLPNQSYLHHYEEHAKRRVEIAHCLAELPLIGALVGHSDTTGPEEEHTRRQLLTWLLCQLQHNEGAGHVVIESRTSSDKHDRRTRDRLLRSRTLSSAMRVTHASKTGDELLWMADFFVSAHGTALLHDQREPWDILTAAHVIEVAANPR